MNTAPARTISNRVPRFLLHACQRCHGDGILDAEAREYRCLQCSRTVAEAPAPSGPLYRFARFDDDRKAA